jgi:hypothetical protein
MRSSAPSNHLSAAAAGMVMAALVGSGAACKPDLGSPISLVGGPRILAVRGMPPEAKEMAPVTYDLLAVDVDGTIASPQAMWAVCKVPRPPSDSGSINPQCLTIPDDAGPAPTFTAPIPSADPNDPNSNGACSLFGPIKPTNDPTARPRDPDVTGGYYLPVRVTLPDDGGGGTLVAFDLERIQCRLIASQDIANAFNAPTTGYQPNTNPAIGGLTLAVGGGAPMDVALTVPGTTPVEPAASVSPGQRVALEASWAADSAETFPVFDLQTLVLDQQRESLRVSWFATGGVFDHDVTGRESDDMGLTVDDGWVAPEQAGLVHFWLVLTDSRGGVDFVELAVNVGS